MSIINQALKKAQRERRPARDGESWVESAPLGTGTPPGRRRILWVVPALLLALGVGTVAHTWYSGAPTNLPAVQRPGRPVADAASQMQSVRLTKNPAQAPEPAARSLPSTPRQLPTRSETANTAPKQSVRIAAARQPALAPAHYVSQGNDLYRQGQYQGAVDMYRAALELQPSDLKARNNLGIAYMQLAMDDRAIAAFEEVLRLDSTYGLAYYNLACVHARAGNAAEAADFLRQAMAIEPRARDWARTDGDFARVRDTAQFRRHLEP